MWLFLRGYRGMQEIMTCEICGCSFTDVDNLDYTEVFTTGLCCECILEENWGNRMKCDECNLDMKWFNDFIDSCGCCGTFFYKCPQCGAVKAENYWGG